MGADTVTPEILGADAVIEGGAAIEKTHRHAGVKAAFDAAAQLVGIGRRSARPARIFPAEIVQSLNADMGFQYGAGGLAVQIAELGPEGQPPEGHGLLGDLVAQTSDASAAFLAIEYMFADDRTQAYFSALASRDGDSAVVDNLAT